jgi:hypothetical protein
MEFGLINANGLGMSSAHTSWIVLLIDLSSGRLVSTLFFTLPIGG